MTPPVAPVKKPFHVGIFSGKGGVGKTSITASIACAMAEKGIKILAADTDVDAPNLAILFQAQTTVKNEFTVQTTEKATLIEDQCTHCKRCVDEKFCHFSAIAWDEEQSIPIIDTIACEGCKACQLLCPEKAFSIDPVDSGTVRHVHSIYGFDVITGETILGAQTSGKLVSELKVYSTEVAKDSDCEVIILDGPPGIGCPVIAAMTDLHYVIVVIEPTSAALHDAERLIQVVSNFNIPYGVIINKSDMYQAGYETVMAYLTELNIELLGEIPLDNDWPYAIARGKPIYIDKPNGPSAKHIREILNQILPKIQQHGQ